MDNLLQAMQTIYKYSDVIPEGDYLSLCNKLKEAYDKKTRPVPLFDYENYSFDVDDEYLSTHFYDMSVDFDVLFIHDQLNYLHSDLVHYEDIKRVTKFVKSTVKEEYCKFHGISEEEFDEQIKPSKFKKMCKDYVKINNAFRAQYREALFKKILWLEEYLEYLDTL